MNAFSRAVPLHPNLFLLFSLCLSILLTACGGGGSGSDNANTGNEAQTMYSVDVFGTPTDAGSYTGGGQYSDGTVVTLSARANEGYVFEGWFNSGDLLSTDPDYEISVDRSYVYQALFRPAPTVASLDVPSDGIVTLFEAKHSKAGVIYAATKEATVGDGQEGLWRSTDSGASWEKLLPGGVRFITIASGDSSLIIAGIASSYHISSDGGDTWTSGQIQELIFGGFIAFNDAASVTSTKGIYLTSSNAFAPGLYKTTNLGASWTRILSEVEAGSDSDAQLDSVAVAPQDSNILYTATTFETNIWASQNGGEGFISIKNGLSTESFVFNDGISVNPLNPDQVFITSNISVNGGANWTQVTNLSPDTAFWFEGNLVRFSSEAFEGFLEFSSDYGATWTYLMPLIDDEGPGFWGIDDVFVAEDTVYFEQGTGSAVSAQIFRIERSQIQKRLAEL